MSEIVPPPGRLYSERRKAVTDAATKDEARDAIEPILASLVLYEPTLEVGPEMMLRGLAADSVLTLEEVEGMYDRLLEEWDTMVSDDQQSNTTSAA